MIYNEKIQALIQFGYTAREAAFLVLVCRVAGYFTRAQYNAFVRRESGGLAQQLIDRALQKQHLRVIECSRNRHIYHVTAPVIYQRIEGSDSTSRRLKGDDEIRRRLLVLDTCIRRADARILGSEAEKASFFGGLDVPRRVIPWARNAADELAITKIRRYCPPSAGSCSGAESGSANRNQVSLRQLPSSAISKHLYRCSRISAQLNSFILRTGIECSCG